MPGFPTRIARSALGPTRVDRYAPKDATKEVTASQFNLDFWQLAGCNIVVPLAWAEIVVDALDAATLGQHGEAWNPEGAIAGPILTHPGVGHFTLTYLATYNDEAGSAIATNLRWTGTPCVQSATWWRAQGLASAANVIEVYVWDSAGAPDDPTSSSIFVPVW